MQYINVCLHLLRHLSKKLEIRIAEPGQHSYTLSNKSLLCTHLYFIIHTIHLHTNSYQNKFYFFIHNNGMYRWEVILYIVFFLTLDYKIPYPLTKTHDTSSQSIYILFWIYDILFQTCSSCYDQSSCKICRSFFQSFFNSIWIAVHSWTWSILEHFTLQKDSKAKYLLPLYRFILTLL